MTRLARLWRRYRAWSERVDDMLDVYDLQW